MAEPRLACPAPAPPPMRPQLSEQASRFTLLEREVEQEYRPQMLAALQRKVDAVAEEVHATAPACLQCAHPMSYHDRRLVGWRACWGRVQASVSRYRCARCKLQRRPVLEVLGVEAGRICGSLARQLALLATVA